jgi:hypothetical protein
MAERDVPIFDYPVLSDDGREAPRPGAEWTERVWVFVDNWEKGNELGQVTIKYLKGGNGPPQFEATFSLSGFETIVVSGSVPGGKRWVGVGSAKAVGGGRPDKDVDIEFRNPKRW